MPIKHYIGGNWCEADASEVHVVRNPATEEILCETPLATAADVDRAVKAAAEAFDGWRATPVVERARLLRRLLVLMESRRDELARILTSEHGKTLSEAAGSIQRALECIEVAIGAPSLMMGQSLEDIARDVDCTSTRQPLGVCAAIAPFNFPAMVPLWFFPFAVACGNTFVLKPSEQVPLCQQFIFELVHEAGFPPGVLNIVHGGRDVVERMIEHPDIRALSFVGSTPVARIVYAGASAAGKRVQALGGAKNFLVVMPDANMDDALDGVVASACGCAGERCLAGSNVIAVGDCHDVVRDGLSKRMRAMTTGDGTKDGIDMGPVISASALKRVRSMVEEGVREGAELVVDGREVDLPEKGYFLGPCLFDGVTDEMAIGRDEVFGPVLSIMTAPTLEAALDMIHAQPLANAASIFTSSGGAARAFAYSVPASMTGVNIGVAAPMTFFGFGGNKQSFFGDLKAHGRESFDFYTDRKVVISRWPDNE